MRLYSARQFLRSASAVSVRRNDAHFGFYPSFDLYIPFFGWGMALLRMIPIDRSKGKNAFEQVVRVGKRRLAGGAETYN